MMDGRIVLCSVALTVLALFCGAIQTQKVTNKQEGTLNAAVEHYFKNYRQAETQRKFFKIFEPLPPEERVRIWLRSAKLSHLDEGDIKPVMVIHGLDCIPILMDVVRTKGGEDRLLALKLLCEMDRYVPLADLPLKQEGGAIRDWLVANRFDAKSGGYLNRFMLVDGRRIGKAGKDLIYWATEQSKDEDLRFHAREHSGLLREDLERLSPEQVFAQWKSAVIRSGKYFQQFYYTDDNAFIGIASQVLMENPLQSIPLMTGILKKEKNGYVQKAAFSFLNSADIAAMRFRATDSGIQAIEAMYQVIVKDTLRPKLTEKGRSEVWKDFIAQAIDDDTELQPGGTLLMIARAFEQYYGEKSTMTTVTKGGATVPDVVPEMRSFITYLTSVDPFFPSWEFTIHGYPGGDAILHPRFKQKMARYYECWKQFKANKFALPTRRLAPELMKMCDPFGAKR